MTKQIIRRKEIRREKVMQIRLTESELASIKELAKVHNTTVTKLILHKLFS